MKNVIDKIISVKNLFIVFILLALYFSCRDNEQKNKDEEKIARKIRTNGQDTTRVDDSKVLMPPGGYDTTNAEVQLRRRPKPPSPTYEIFLQGTGTSASTIKLIWQGGTPNFIVYRLLANRVNAVSVTTTSAYSHTVTGLLPATHYEFFIKDSKGVSSDTLKVPTMAGSGTGNAVVLLDFDGHSWGGRNHAPSGLSQEQIIYHVDSVRREAARINPNLIITTDEAVYASANPFKRIRQILTTSWEWYGQAGGVSYLGSFSFGNDTPSWVFTSLLSFNSGNIIRASIHELGHTFSLNHVTNTLPAPFGNWMTGMYGSKGLFENPHSSGVYQINIINSKL